jgi:hypothetical protein
VHGVTTPGSTFPTPGRSVVARSRSVGVPSIVLASVGDPAGTRTVSALVVLLAALGVALVMVAVWLVRVTRPDPELLAPLEVMGERTWRRSDPVSQRRRIDEVRPAGADPLQPRVAPPDLDEAFERGPDATGFDDLRSPTPGERPDVPVEGAPDDPTAAEQPQSAPE